MINKKGIVMEILAFIVISIVMVFLFAGFIYGFGIINQHLTSGEMDSSAANISSISSNTFSQLNTGMSQLRIIALMIIFGYFLATMITAYFSTKHPLWLFVYILISLLLVIFSIYISNAYETMQSNTVLGSTIGSFTEMNVIILYLPYWVSIMCLIGIALSVVGIFTARRLIE